MKRKKCTKCKTTKPFDEFYARLGRPCGRQSRCKKCTNAIASQSVRRKLWAKMYGAKTSTKIAARKKQAKYKAAHYDEVVRRQRLRRKQHPEIDARWREHNRGKLSARNKQWARDNARATAKTSLAGRRALCDVYLKCLLSKGLLAPSDIPEELIELKRQQLLLARMIKEKRT